MLFHSAYLFACGAWCSTQQAWVSYMFHHGGRSLLWSSRCTHFSLFIITLLSGRAHRPVCAFQIDCINQTNWKPAVQTGQSSVSIGLQMQRGIDQWSRGDKAVLPSILSLTPGTHSVALDSGVWGEAFCLNESEPWVSCPSIPEVVFKSEDWHCG